MLNTIVEELIEHLARNREAPPVSIPGLDAGAAQVAAFFCAKLQAQRVKTEALEKRLQQEVA